jgi:hypothetical protein
VRNSLGKGGTGRVYEVEKVSNHKIMVIKTIELGEEGSELFEKNCKSMK